MSHAGRGARATDQCVSVCVRSQMRSLLGLDTLAIGVSYLVPVSEIKHKFMQETIAKIQLCHYQAFGGCLHPACRTFCTAQNSVLLMAPDSQGHHKAIKDSAFLCPSSGNFSCLLPFPGDWVEEGHGTALLAGHRSPTHSHSLCRPEERHADPPLHARQSMAVFQDTS